MPGFDDYATISAAGEGNSIRNQSGIEYNTVKSNQMPVVAREVDGYRERFANDASQATRVFDVPWTARQGFRQWALGRNMNVAGKLRRTLPAQHPESTWLYAQECELLQGLGFIFDNPLVLPVDQFGQQIAGPPIPMIGYFDSSPAQEAKILADGLARYAVTYRALDYAIYPDSVIDDQTNELTELHRWVSRDTTYSVQSLKIPNWELVFKDNLQPIPEGGFLLSKSGEIIYRWHEVPDPPEEGIDECLGCVNDEIFDEPVNFQGQPCNGTPPNGYPAGSLLMMTKPEKKRYRSSAGRVLWDITYHFLYRAQGHNFFPDKDGVYREVMRKDNGNPVYESADFKKLFTQPATPFLWQGPGG